MSTIRRISCGLVLATAFSVSLPAYAPASASVKRQAQSSSPKPAADLSYNDMLKKVEAGDMSVDFGVMRMKYASGNSEGASSDDINALYKHFNDQDYKGAVDQANKIMKSDYVSLDAHMVASAAYKELHNDAASQLHHDIAAGLLKSIMSPGTGASVDSPYTVISVDEEYAFMRAMGYRPHSQAYIHNGEKSFDKMDMIDTKDGSEVTVFFDVTFSDQKMFKGLK
jgi:hypothetical protein